MGVSILPRDDDFYATISSDICWDSLSFLVIRPCKLLLNQCLFLSTSPISAMLRPFWKMGVMFLCLIQAQESLWTVVGPSKETQSPETDTEQAILPWNLISLHSRFSQVHIKLCIRFCYCVDEFGPEEMRPGRLQMPDPSWSL